MSKITRIHSVGHRVRVFSTMAFVGLACLVLSSVGSGQTTAPARNREVEKAKLIEESRKRFGPGSVKIRPLSRESPDEKGISLGIDS